VKRQGILHCKIFATPTWYFGCFSGIVRKVIVEENARKSGFNAIFGVRWIVGVLHGQE
jgi:hypothetical protein